MKKVALFLILLSVALFADAQTSFDTYFRKVPALPRDSCNISKQAKEAFEESIRTLIDELSADIDSRNQNADTYADNNRGAMEANAIKNLQQQYNISDEDINKMKSSKGMTEAEKKEMANKVMMQQTNMSMEEVQRLSKMSDAGKKAWAEAYAAEAQANAQSNPQTATASAGMNSNARNLMSLQQEQSILISKINGGQQKIGTMYASIENDPAGKVMRDNIDKWNSKLTSMMGEVTQKQEKTMDSLAVLVSEEQKKYCDKFTPQYRAVLRKDLANLKASITDCRRLDYVTGEIMKAQTGVDPSPAMIEISSLGALKGYLDHLNDAYKYKLSYPGE
jgi:hypothetical protein